MQLWLLKERLEPDYYDNAAGFVVRANRESDARYFAQQKAGDEKKTHPDFWLSNEHSSCEELKYTGEPGVILRDFNAA